MQALILRVLVVDDSEIVRRGICQILQSQADIEVSSPGELHPEALSELYMNLSAHTAPTMEPRRTPICQ